MSMFRPSQLPLAMEAAKKRQVRSQFAALPFRVTDDGCEILLITSRTRKRWIIPKGWPEPGMTPAESAEKEAFEEGGVKGKAYDLCLGVYSYPKYMDDGTMIPCLGMVYPLRVKTVVAKYPERHERRRKWFSPKKASSLVSERELKKIIKTFDPHWLVRRKS